MPIDIFQSRRGYDEYCRWWSRNESIEDNDEIVRNRVPSGYFFAKEISGEASRNNVVNGIFMFDRTDISIQTPDNVFGIKANDLVEYQGEKWIVDSVQKSKARIQQSEYAFDKNVSHYWIITIRK